MLQTTDAFDPEVYDMTQFSKFRIIALGAGLTTLTVLAALAQSGSAQASSALSQCTSPSSQKTVSCCGGPLFQTTPAVDAPGPFELPAGRGLPWFAEIPDFKGPCQNMLDPTAQQ